MDREHITREEELALLKEEYLQIQIPEDLQAKMRSAMEKAKKDKRRAMMRRRWRYFGAAAAAAVVVLVTPNVNSDVARTMEGMPLIGGFVKAITVRDIAQQDVKETGEGEKENGQTTTETARVSEATGDNGAGSEVVSNINQDEGKASENKEAQGEVETGSTSDGGKTSEEVSTTPSGEAGKDTEGTSQTAGSQTTAGQASSGTEGSGSEGTQDKGGETKEAADTSSSSGDNGAAVSTETPEESQEEAFTQKLLAEFKSDMKSKGYLGYNMDYKVVTNDKSLFTLGVYATVTDLDGKNIERYYHIDKKSGEGIQLSDLFPEGSNYIESLSSEIRDQIKQEMKEDASREYYSKADVKKYGKSISYFTTIDKNQNFYFDEDGNLVLVFDEQTIAPSFMGTPKFTIAADLVEQLKKKSATTEVEPTKTETQEPGTTPKGDNDSDSGKSETTTPKGEEGESTGKEKETVSKGSGEDETAILEQNSEGQDMWRR